MSLIYLITFLAVLLVVLIEVLACGFILLNKDVKPPVPNVLPKVAILIAARNEALNLKRCFAALEKLDYPADKLTVWIGNDGSTDETLAIARELAAGKENWQVLDIKEEWGRAKGKANVLAQLAHAARQDADYYFITDADMAVSPSWLLYMLGFFRKDIALVSGTSVVEHNYRFGRWQAFDWYYGLGLATAFTYFPRIGQSLTATGNNMAVNRKAYEAVGGYESIPFSVTEDYELHRQLRRLGFKNLHISLEEVKARTLPVKNYLQLLHQRRRWMSGALQLPGVMVAILCLQALFFPAILVVLYWNTFLGIALLVLKLLARALFVRKMMKRLGEPPSLPFLGYELYATILNMSLLLFYLLPVPLYWKGRSYRKFLLK